MPSSEDFFDDPDSTREQIIEATFHALCEHGYSNLTLDKIGEEFDKSTSLIYHHYDGKDALLLDLLEYLLQEYKAGVPFSTVDPAAQIEELIEGTLQVGDTTAGFGQALVELRAQATHDEAYRDMFERTDELIQNQIAQIVRTGVEDGSFVAVDPETTASLLHVTMIGIHTAQCTGTEATTTAAHEALDRCIEENLKR